MAPIICKKKKEKKKTATVEDVLHIYQRKGNSPCVERHNLFCLSEKLKGGMKGEPSEEEPKINTHHITATGQ